VEDAQRGKIEVVAEQPGGKVLDRLSLAAGAGATWDQARDHADVRSFLAKHPVGSAGSASPTRGRGSPVGTRLEDVRKETSANPLQDGAPTEYTLGELVVFLRGQGGSAGEVLARVPFQTLAAAGDLLRQVDQTRVSTGANGSLVAVAGHVEATYPSEGWSRRTPVRAVARLAGDAARSRGASATPLDAPSTGGEPAAGCAGCTAGGPGAGAARSAAGLGLLVAAMTRRRSSRSPR